MTASEPVTTGPPVGFMAARWTSRLVAGGVDHNDIQEAIPRLAEWHDWCPTFCEVAARHEALAVEADERGSAVSAAEARAQAAATYHFAKFFFFDDPLYDHANAKAIALFAQAAPDLDPPAERVQVPYEGTMLVGYLRRPPGVDRPPVVLLLAGIDGTKEEMHPSTDTFLRRGMATLTLDGPGQGESELPVEPAYEKAVTAVVEWLAGRTDVDGSRFGIVGLSLGGYYAARGAAYEPGVACAVDVGGPFNFAECLTERAGMSLRALRARSHSPDDDTARQRAAELDLTDAAPHIEIPLLVVHGGRDFVVPVSHAERLVAAASSADKRLALYPEGAHCCTNLMYAWLPMAADWVAERLGATSP